MHNSLDSWQVIHPLDLPQSTEVDPSSSDESPFLYCLNLIHCKKDGSAKRGATIRAISVCSTYSFIHIFKVCYMAYLVGSIVVCL